MKQDRLEVYNTFVQAKADLQELVKRHMLSSKELNALVEEMQTFDERPEEEISLTKKGRKTIEKIEKEEKPVKKEKPKKEKSEGKADALSDEIKDIVKEEWKSLPEWGKGKALAEIIKEKTGEKFTTTQANNIIGRMKRKGEIPSSDSVEETIKKVKEKLSNPKRQRSKNSILVRKDLEDLDSLITKRKEAKGKGCTDDIDFELKSSKKKVDDSELGDVPDVSEEEDEEESRDNDSLENDGEEF